MTFNYTHSSFNAIVKSVNITDDGRKATVIFFDDDTGLPEEFSTTDKNRIEALQQELDAVATDEVIPTHAVVTIATSKRNNRAFFFSMSFFR